MGMSKFKVEFAPLNLPLKRRIQTLSAAVWFFGTAFAGLFCSLFTLYLLFFTKFWWLTAIYLVWIFLDRHTCETGGRRFKWVQSWEWWGYLRNYFPIRLHRLPFITYDPSKNYLFCCFPHGMLTAGAFSVFSTEQGEFVDYFPGLKPYLCVLAQHCHTPFFRELMMATGAVAPSVKSLDYLLSKPGGGNAVGLIVGGAAEAYYCKPRQYKLVLKNRKGFAKVALRNGSPLVPVFSFGENDLFSQVDAGDGSLYKKCQELLRKVIGMSPIIPLGRGLLQYSYGLVPHRRPVNVVVGAPIHVEKTENPTQSQIDDLHKQFTEAIQKLFETQKHTYIKDADDVILELV